MTRAVVEVQHGLGFPTMTGYLAHHPARVRAVLLGTVHQAHAVAVPDVGSEVIEVTTCCGLTDTTDRWRYAPPPPALASISTRWLETGVDRHNPPCPRCAAIASPSSTPTERTAP